MNTSSSTDAKEYRIPVKAELIRSFQDPHSSQIRLLHAYVRVSDFPHGKMPDEINPRRHENLKGHIPADIRTTLENSPQIFHLLNRGLLVIAENAWYDNKLNMLHIRIGPQAEGGLADGATTDRVISKTKREIGNAEFESLTESEIPQFLKDAYVHLEIISGLNGDSLVPLTAARNTSVQVKEFALEDLRGGYKELKDILESSRFKNRVRYRENDVQPVDVRTILGLLTLFHPKWNELNKEPIIAYAYKGAVLENYQDKEWSEGYMKVIPIVCDVLELHDYVHVNFAAKYKEAKEAVGEGAKFGRRMEIRNKETSLALTGQKAPYGIPDGWVYPLLASMRELLVFPKTSKALVKWQMDPKKFFDKYGSTLVDMVIEYSDNMDRNPQATGKSKFLYSSLRARVELLIQKAL